MRSGLHRGTPSANTAIWRVHWRLSCPLLPSLMRTVRSPFLAYVRPLRYSNGSGDWSMLQISDSLIRPTTGTSGPLRIPTIDFPSIMVSMRRLYWIQFWRTGSSCSGDFWALFVLHLREMLYLRRNPLYQPVENMKSR